MSLSANEYSRLMRFLDADMSEDEITTFAAEVSENDELRSLLQFEQSVRDGFMVERRTKQKNVVHKTKGIIKKLRNRQPQTWAIAAAILGIIICTGYFLIRMGPTVPDTVKTNAPTPRTKTDSVRGTQKPVTTVQKSPVNTDSLFEKNAAKEPVPTDYPMYLAQAFDDYTAGNYRTITALQLDALPQTRGMNDEHKNIRLLGHFYKAMAALQLRKETVATTHLKWVEQHAEAQSWKQKVHWYLAMAALQKGDVGTVVRELNSISTTGIYAGKAQQILKLISSNE